MKTSHLIILGAIGIGIYVFWQPIANLFGSKPAANAANSSGIAGVASPNGAATS